MRKERGESARLLSLERRAFVGAMVSALGIKRLLAIGVELACCRGAAQAVFAVALCHYFMMEWEQQQLCDLFSPFVESKTRWTRDFCRHDHNHERVGLRGLLEVI